MPSIQMRAESGKAKAGGNSTPRGVGSLPFRMDMERGRGTGQIEGEAWMSARGCVINSEGGCSGAGVRATKTRA